MERGLRRQEGKENEWPTTELERVQDKTTQQQRGAVSEGTDWICTLSQINSTTEEQKQLR